MRNGCSSELQDIQVDEPGAWNVNFGVQSTSMANNDGGIVTSVSGATPPYTYNWSTLAVGGNIDTDAQNQSGLTPGLYFVTISDSRGCLYTEDSLLVEGVIQVSGDVENVSCNGEDDGSIDLMIAGGVPPFRFEWSDGGPRVEDRSDLSPGSYDVTVTDAAGTTMIQSFEIDEPDAIILNASVTDVTGNNCDGIINLTVEGGSLPYSYQ